VELYLVRHAVAFKRDPDRWPDDSRRPLTPRSEAYFRSVASGLGRMAPRVEVLLSSPLERAWRTAEILAEAAPWPAPQALPALEPDIPPHKAVIALETYADAGSVVLVGHRPGLHELASYLLTGDAGGAEIRIKKGGAVCLAFDGAPEPGTGALRWLLTPKNLRSMPAPR
jgi:phosphohistidine phosphatase